MNYKASFIDITKITSINRIKITAIYSSKITWTSIYTGIICTKITWTIWSKETCISSSISRIIRSIISYALSTNTGKISRIISRTTSCMSCIVSIIICSISALMERTSFSIINSSSITAVFSISRVFRTVMTIEVTSFNGTTC